MTRYVPIETVLEDGKVWTVGKLASASGQSPSAVVRVLGKLEGNGLAVKVAGGWKRAE